MGAGTIYIVSGLPRSGTSMVMQMLAAGGASLLTDGARPADADNPGGYCEFEPVKRLKTDSSWVPQAEGKVVKVISRLLEYLPADFVYKVLFMRRSLDEILASQRAMLERGGRRDELPDAVMRRYFEEHLHQVGKWLAAQKNFAVLDLPHARVLEEPSGMSAAMAAFTGLPLQVERMAAVVDERLYRQRGAETDVSAHDSDAAAR